MENKKRNSVATVLLTIVCILWMYPIVLILINSLKKEVAITTSGVFSLPTSETWNGVANFVASVTQMDFLKSFWYSLVISVMSVVLILLCCSMCDMKDTTVTYAVKDYKNEGCWKEKTISGEEFIRRLISNERFKGLL